MATVRKHLLTLGLTLAFLLGATIQVLPCAMAEMDMGVHADMAAGCTGAAAPCTDSPRACIDHIGCLTVLAVPTSAAALVVPFRWTSVAYEFAATQLSGLPVKPELSPPIRAA